MQSNKPANNKKRQAMKSDSFLEAFRDLGSDFASSLTGNPATGQSEAGPDHYESLYQRESDLEKKYRSQLRQVETIKREEKILFTRQEKEAQQQVKALQEEIKTLAKATADLAHEVEIAAQQETPTAGKYHVTFFEKLLASIKVLRKQVQESSYWLASWNKKAQKRNYYWGQFKKSGSKFSLSADRYTSTQAG